MSATSRAQGTAFSISARKRSRRVCFFLAANSAYAKMVWGSMPQLTNPRLFAPD